jgi:uncharacterized protein
MNKVISLLSKIISAIWTIIWKTFGFISFWGFLAFFFMPYGNRQSNKLSQFQVLYLDAGVALAAFIAAWLAVHYFDKRPFVSLGLTPKRLPKDLLLGIGIGAGMLALAFGIILSSGLVKNEGLLQTSWTALTITVLCAVVSSIMQEALFRSYIFQTIRSETNPTLAVVLTSILFSAFHLATFQGNWLMPAINVFILGVLLGMAYHISGNLWLPIGIHAAWNFPLNAIIKLTFKGQDLLNKNGGTFASNQIIGTKDISLATNLIVTFALTAFIIILIMVYCRQAEEGNMKRFSILILILAVFSSSLPCREKTYYMDKSGNLLATQPKNTKITCSVPATTFIIDAPGAISPEKYVPQCRRLEAIISGELSEEFLKNPCDSKKMLCNASLVSVKHPSEYFDGVTVWTNRIMIHLPRLDKKIKENIRRQIKRSMIEFYQAEWLENKDIFWHHAPESVNMIASDYTIAYIE